MGDSARRAAPGSPARVPNGVCADDIDHTPNYYGPFANPFMPEAVSARSGEFTVGPRPRYGKQSFKLWWHPLVADTSAVLTITAYRLDSAVAPVRFEQRAMARSGELGMPRSSGGGRLFYPTHPVLPRRGVWALVGAGWRKLGLFRLSALGLGLIHPSRPLDSTKSRSRVLVLSSPGSASAGQCEDAYCRIGLRSIGAHRHAIDLDVECVVVLKNCDVPKRSIALGRRRSTRTLPSGRTCAPATRSRSTR